MLATLPSPCLPALQLSGSKSLEKTRSRREKKLLILLAPNLGMERPWWRYDAQRGGVFFFLSTSSSRWFGSRSCPSQEEEEEEEEVIYTCVRVRLVCTRAACLRAMLGVRRCKCHVCRCKLATRSKTMGGRDRGHGQCQGTCWR